MIVTTVINTNRNEMNKKTWTEQEVTYLIEQSKKRPNYISYLQWELRIAKELKRTIASVRTKAQELRRMGEIEREYITASPYPVYREPLVMTGDAVVLPDIEFPFHAAEFMNNVLGLAEAWGIRQCILAGDVLHLDSLSTFDKNFTDGESGGLTEEAERTLLEQAQKLPDKYREALIGTIADIGRKEQADGLSTELEVARRELRRLSDLFDTIHYVIGNHEGRALRALQNALDPQILLRLTEAGDKFKIAAYYFSYLDTPRGRYQIEHPKGAAEGTAQQLAAKFHAHVIMGHSHLLDFSWDVSGMYYAIHAGHCVDEARLPYASQRHTTRRAHKNGAVIVRDGFPWLLHDDVDWERLKEMRN